jgi:hypothetical protein
MAVSLGFGILFATFITLYLIPSGYLLLEDILALGRRTRSWFFKPFAGTEEPPISQEN